MCVGNDDDMRSVVLGDDGALAGMAEGCVLVDHTTASADIARELAAARPRAGDDFIDAPVSGGQAGAENGQLTVMCGGEPAAFDRAKPVMDCYAQGGHADGPGGRRPAHQDGQPDLHRRPGPGAVGGASTSACAPASTWTR